MEFKGASRIIKNKDLLSLEYAPKRITGRERELRELAFQFSYLFRDYPSLPNLLIFGNVGTGKTCCIKYTLNELKEEIKKGNGINLKIVQIKGTESRTKYEILKKIYSAVISKISIPKTIADLHSSIVQWLSEKGVFLLIFLDEIHEIRDSELNNTLFTISRLGEDISYAKESTEKLVKPKKSHVGYIMVSNDANIRNKLKDNTRSSLTREILMFRRYETSEIVDILKDRIKDGALHGDSVEEGVLEMISALSVKEGQDARYALLLLSNVAKETEKRKVDKITQKIVESVNEVLLEDYMKSLLRELPPIHLEILLIIYDLYKNEDVLNSKTIWEEYKRRTYLSKINFSRICQIVTDLEKNNIIYVTQSRKTKLRNLSIEENLTEIEEVLKERGKI